MDGNEQPQEQLQGAVVKPKKRISWQQRPKLSVELLKVRCSCTCLAPRAPCQLPAILLPHLQEPQGFNDVFCKFPGAMRSQFKGRGHEVSESGDDECAFFLRSKLIPCNLSQLGGLLSVLAGWGPATPARAVCALAAASLPLWQLR
jgi:hypothetical protein